MRPEQQQQISQVHPYLQAQVELTITPEIGMFKFRLGEEVKHVKTGGIYIIVGLPNEFVIEATREAAYAYLMPDGRTCIRSQTEMEDGRFESAGQGAAVEWLKIGTNLTDWLAKSKAPDTSVVQHTSEKWKVKDVITFEEFVDYGRREGTHLVDGIPWSFTYKGHPITHETDDCYIVPSISGAPRKFVRGEVLVTGMHGGLVPCSLETFGASFEVESEDRENVAVPIAGERFKSGDQLLEVDGKLVVSRLND
jgi:hypothetical protein